MNLQDTTDGQSSESLLGPRSTAGYGGIDSPGSSIVSTSSAGMRRKEAHKLNQSPEHNENNVNIPKELGSNRDNEFAESTYDFVPDDVPESNSKRDEHPTSDFDTLVHLIKGNVGTGLLSLPLAVSRAGLVVGGLSIVLLGLLATHCMIMLVNAARQLIDRHFSKTHTLDYAGTFSEAVREHTRNKFTILPTVSKVVVNVFLIFTQFGFCCVYFVFIADNLNQVFCSAFGVSLGASQINSVHAWIAIVMIPMIVFSWIRNLDELAPFTATANVCILFSLAIILYAEVASFVTTDPEYQAAAIRPKNESDSFGHGGGIYYGPTQFLGLALFFGNAIYSFEGIGMVLPLENKMKKPWHFKRVIYIAMGIVIFLYVFVGTVGYAVYGASILGSITLNLELSEEKIADSIFYLLAKLFYSFAIFASFLLQFYVPMDFLEPLLKYLALEYRFPRHHKRVLLLTQCALRTTCVVIIAIVAIAIPDLGDLISLIGAVASSTLALIFPPLLDIMVFAKRDNLILMNPISWPVIKQTIWITKDVLIMTLGIVGFFLGAYASIDDLVNFFEHDSDLKNTCVVFYP